MNRDHLPRRTSSRSAQVRTRPKPEGGPVPLDSLVASARRISGKRMTRAAAARWQDEAWAMYDEVGELRFVANALASASSKARVFAATVAPGDADPEPIHADDPDADPDDRPTADEVLAAETVEALARNVLGRAEMIRRIVLHLFVPGDGYLIGLPPGILDLNGPEDAPPELAEEGLRPEGGWEVSDLSWHSLSVSEVRISNGKARLNIGDGAPVEVDEDECVVVRVWRPHPRRWWEADSPVRSNLPVLREHVGATIDSRLAGAGLLVLPQSVEVVGNAHDPETSATEPPADFVEALLDTMATAIEDRDSAAALVPLTIKVPDEVAANFGQKNWIRFDTPFDKYARELRDEAIRRLALGLDAPPEVLLGLGDTNHWSAWQIDEATAKIHIEPVLALLCDALTTQYLWPALKSAGIADVQRYVVWFDSSDLTMRPNRTAEAMDLYDRGELKGEALRRESGFDENDKPEATTTPATDLVLSVVRGSPNLVGANPALIFVLLEIVEALMRGEHPGADLERRAAEAVAPPGGGGGGGGDGGDGGPGEPTGSGTDLPDTQGEPPPDAMRSSNGHRSRAEAPR
jgi:hypothetical protein